ncbi:hypothetical protein ACEPPN_007225 [Leptodophora sp. 'Broadleaf-Isolate-01']
MDSSTSDASQESSSLDSSSADSTSADSPMQALPMMSETQDPTELASPLDKDDSDSDSDVSMSTETDDEEDNGPPESILVLNSSSEVAIPSQVDTSKKRKFSESSEPANDQPRNEMTNEVRKRLKPDDTEIDLLLSSSIPSPLMAALPFIFLTNENHVLSSAALQNATHPASLKLTKHFFNFQVDEIKKEFEEVKAMGSATAEEWLKGLEGRGRERKNDAARWERWEASGGIAKMLGSVTLGQNATNSVSVPPTMMQPINGNLPPHPGNNPLFLTNQNSQLPPPQNSLSESIYLDVDRLDGAWDHHTNARHLATNPPPRFDSPAQNGFAHYTPRPQPQAKHERTKEEVAELKAARRAEIERRCSLLDPPITPGVLAHMPSFQAAIQIIQPLVDGSWEVLKPRLISQREEAEQRENDRVAQTRVVQERFDERRLQDMQSRSDSKDLVEREWDDMQAPLRARIGSYADETIRDGWNGGEKVSYETSPLFAAGVLIYVRKRFYAEVAKDEAAVRATGREPELDPPHGPFTRKLILENMKWVFDTKIKPHTEQYRKELFLCNACEFANKYYGFEGVIQHFAAKHTSSLSVGSVVVHWKSEWPEYPPFNPEPDNAVKPYYPAAASGTVPYPSNGPATQQNYGYGGYPVPVSTPMPGPNPHVYQESPGPYYGHPQFGDQYSGHQNGPYAPPPQPYQDPSQAFQSQQYSVAPHVPSIAGYNDAPQDYSQNGYGAQYQPPQDMYANQGQQYPPPASEMPGQPAPYDTSAQYGPSYNQVPSYPPNDIPQPPQKTEQYIAQLQDLARNARDIWNSIGSIKEVPGSLKVYTIIYHLLKRFRETYHEDPPLAMMVDGLSSNKDMRPVRNVNGLLCKACTLGMAGSLPGSQKKHFSFPQLVNHFHTIHDLGLSKNYGVPLDWTRDMVDLPDTAKLTAVVNAPGINDEKLALFTEAVPEIIPAPRPASRSFHDETHQHYGQFAPQNDYPDLAPSKDNHDKYYAVVDNGKPLDTGSTAFDNSEYDPRHPGDLPMDARPLPKSTQRDLRPGQQGGARNELASHQYDERYEVDIRQEPYGSRSERSYVEQRPLSSSRAIPVAEHGHGFVREEQPIQSDRRIRYQEAPDVEYRVRRNPARDPEMVYPETQYRATNSRSYVSNGLEQLPVAVYENEAGDRLRPNDEAIIQQSRIYDVAAQISRQAQQVRERHPAKDEPTDAGSEDGEVQADGGPSALAAPILPSDEASNAAQRFLENFHPGEVSSDVEAAVGNHRKADEHDDGARMYRIPVEAQRRVRAGYEEDDREFVNTRRLVNPGVDDMAPNSYIVHERAVAPRPARTYAYEERYVSSGPEHGGQRDRSPELVDRRYKLNNVVYRDERQDSQGTYRTPSRYARYESVRLENDRARSRSPVYVKVGTNTGQYRELSPGPHPAHSLRQEPIYRSRTPQQGAEERDFERAPRQEYYRVYADEPRPREPQYAEAFEFVRVSDPAGDYMIRRPVRREPEPVYAAYEDDVYARQPVYESRAPAPRAAETTFYEEEYDPRHPAPPPPPARQIRYQ